MKHTHKAIQRAGASVLAVLLLAGCAANYKAPETQAQAVRVDVSGSAAEVSRKAVEALIAEGFSIASADASLGVVSTQRRQMTLSQADADIGSTWGIDYLKDKRTSTFVTVTVQAAEGSATIRALIEAEYLPNDPVYGKRMVGVSKGTIERRIAARLN